MQAIPHSAPSQTPTTKPLSRIAHLVLLLCFGALALTSSPSQAQTIVPGKTPGQFGVSPSGAATYSIPIQVPPGIAGMQPKLSLEYNSQGGNGIMGMGWSLAGLSSITRCPKTQAQDNERGAVNYDWDDRFCLDGQRLILVDANGANITNQALYGGGGTQYRTEMESFSQITAYGIVGSGPEYFIVKTKAGLTMLYGNTGDSVTITGTGTRISWGLTTITDVKGNHLNVTYWPDYANGMTYPIQIDYAGNAVTFGYEAGRPDVVPLYRAGAVISTSLRLIEVRTQVGATPFQRTTMSYFASASPERSVITKIQSCSATANSQCLQAMDFFYPQNSNSLGLLNMSSSSIDWGYEEGRSWVDVNGDGLADYCRVVGQNGNGGQVACTL